MPLRNPLELFDRNSGAKFLMSPPKPKQREVVLDQSLPKWAVSAMSAFLPLATRLLTSLEVGFVPTPEVLPRHSMTSSAVANSKGGTERPRALAAFRFITSMIRVGCWIGRSLGFAPFRMLST